MSYNGTGANRADPLNELETRGREMMREFGRVAHSAPTDVVIAAAINVLVNAVRGAYPDRARALARWDELMNGHKAVLERHYDGVTGRRRETFAFNQLIEVPFLRDLDKVRGN